jgi:hypothetical protein
MNLRTLDIRLELCLTSLCCLAVVGKRQNLQSLKAAGARKLGDAQRFKFVTGLAVNPVFSFARSRLAVPPTAFPKYTLTVRENCT